MKKYLRIILEVVLVLALVGIAAFAYTNYSGKKHITDDLTQSTEELDQTKEALDKANEDIDAYKEKIAALTKDQIQLSALRSAFASGAVLADVDALYKKEKSLSADRQAGLGALRMLTNGVSDPSTISAFQKTLELAEWNTRLQTVCAAQNALLSAGQKVTVLADCNKDASQSSADEEAQKKTKELTDKDFKWGYEGDTGPEHWGENYPTCAKGKKQSPMNIIGPFEKAKETLVVDYKDGPLKTINNGHTIQVIPQPGSTLMVNKVAYDLVELHFHRPSEEEIDAKSSAMVVHLVHKNAKGKMAVIAVLINEGKENPAIKLLWANLPPKDTEGQEYAPPKVDFNPASLLPADLSHFTYEGSLSTPPCTEGVMNYVLKTPIELSKGQINKFPFKSNARPVQDFNGRKIGATQ
jgi:carbonic anhydrase